MLELFDSYYISKIIELHRYKRNLIENSQLVDELNRLNYLYEIRNWVQEKDWFIYIEAITDFLNITKYTIIEAETNVSPPE